MDVEDLFWSINSNIHDKVFTRDLFTSNLEAIAQLQRNLPGPNQMVNSLQKANDPDAFNLFGTLCYYSRGQKWIQEDENHTTLLQLGFAKVKDGTLLVKSEMIRLLGNQYINREVIQIAVPMTNPHEIDMPNFLGIIFHHFNPALLEGAYITAFKKGVNDEHVPHEAHYQLQFGACLIRLLSHQGWAVGNEVKKETGKEEIKLDFLVYKGNFQVGIELAASTSKSDIEEHAARPYPHELKLDQYVVVHIAPFLPMVQKAPLSYGIFEADGWDKHRKKARIPVFQSRHNRDYSSVELNYVKPGFMGRFSSHKMKKVK